MKDSKVNKIISSAIKQFSKYGYKKTSIDSIVKDAGVSKGLLFYHFKSKKELYLYLFKYVIEIYTEGVINKFDRSVTDFIEMLRESTKIKLELDLEYPYTIDFYISVVQDEDKPEEIDEILSEAKELANYELYEHILRKTDISKFKEGIDAATAIKVASWVATGFFSEEKILNLDRIEEKMEEYENLLIKLLYKESYDG
ncbi:MAG: TetR family transcriptional regulator [Clostridiales bacterium]|nr:MAG: TetR family transcriptional regulator [Clostridiales bacterium]